MNNLLYITSIILSIISVVLIWIIEFSNFPQVVNVIMFVIIVIPICFMIGTFIIYNLIKED